MYPVFSHIQRACYAVISIHPLVRAQQDEFLHGEEFENTVIVTGSSNPQHLTMPTAAEAEEAMEARKHQHAEVQFPGFCMIM